MAGQALDLPEPHADGVAIGPELRPCQDRKCAQQFGVEHEQRRVVDELLVTTTTVRDPWRGVRFTAKVETGVPPDSAAAT